MAISWAAPLLLPSASYQSWPVVVLWAGALARAAFEHAQKYALERKTMGKPIADSLAVDVPSGLSADTGRPLWVALLGGSWNADFTAYMATLSGVTATGRVGSPPDS